jgi:transcription initiation factor IIE alpha subunit
MSDLRHIHWRSIRDTLCGKRMTVHSRLALMREATGTELANLMQWPVTSIRPRLVELRDAGLIEPTGERRNGEHVWRWVALGTAEARARAEQERAQQGAQLTLSAVM